MFNHRGSEVAAWMSGVVAEGSASAAPPGAKASRAALSMLTVAPSDIAAHDARPVRDAKAGLEREHVLLPLRTGFAWLAEAGEVCDETHRVGTAPCQGRSSSSSQR